MCYFMMTIFMPKVSQQQNGFSDRRFVLVLFNPLSTGVSPVYATLSGSGRFRPVTSSHSCVQLWQPYVMVIHHFVDARRLPNCVSRRRIDEINQL